MPARENFSLVDTAWLHMDDPTSMAMIVGVIMFEKPLDFETVKKLFTERLLRVPRFRQRVREPRFGVGLPQWEEDPNFDLDAHLHLVALPAPHDQNALHQLVGDLMSTPLDFSKPLWQYHLVENYDGGCALICRLHHSMGDGLVLVQVLLSLADNAPEIPTNEHGARVGRGLVSQALKLARRGTNLASQITSMATNPEKLRETALFGASGTVALGKLLLIGPDEPSLFKGEVGVMKRAAWTKPLSLLDVKFVSKAMDATINDILISSVTGALRRYLDARGQDTLDMNLRALIPVNLRAPGDLDLDHLGNQFGLVFLDLPVGIREPVERMAVLKERMDYIKHTPEALVAFGILNAIGATPRGVEKIINSIFGMKATAVMTNVPGPREPLYLMGNRIRGLMFWVPTPAHLALGVSIISYAGQVTVGVSTDASLVPDPDEIVNDFVDEFRALELLALRKLKKEKQKRAARKKRAATNGERKKSNVPRERARAKRRTASAQRDAQVESV
jgi:diacylglycerol O-acyltransferase